MDKSKRCTQFCRLSWRSELRIVSARSGFKQFCFQRRSHSVEILMFYIFISYDNSIISVLSSHDNCMRSLNAAVFVPQAWWFRKIQVNDTLCLQVLWFWKIWANDTLLVPRRPLFTPLEGLCSNFKALQCSYMLRSKMLLLVVWSSLNIKILLNNTQGIAFFSYFLFSENFATLTLPISSNAL